VPETLIPPTADKKTWFLKLPALLLLCTVASAAAPAYGETFSFAIIADPHIDGNPDNKAKFETAVDWINNNKESKDIELTFVLGDISWGGSRGNRNLGTAKKILDRLGNNGITYIPVIGDNEIQAGCEKEFQEVFGPHFNALSRILGNWRKAPAPVAGKYLQNFSFDYKGCHFVCPDFNSRKAGGEGGELHDFAGGSWPWFKSDIEQCPKSKKENIVIMTHVGMFGTGFEFADKFVYSESEMDTIKSFLNGYKDNVDTNYAGHLHLNWYVPVWSRIFVPLYHVRVTDETWSKIQWPESEDPGLTVRWVQADNSGLKISYYQNIETIDEEAPFQK
jgi:hypothetical protein